MYCTPLAGMKYFDLALANMIPQSQKKHAAGVGCICLLQELRDLHPRYKSLYKFSYMGGGERVFKKSRKPLKPGLLTVLFVHPPPHTHIHDMP